MKKLFTLIFILFSLTAIAQTDSILLSLSGGGEFNSGNVNSSKLNFILELSGYKNNHTWSITPSYKYIENQISPSNKSTSTQNEFYSVQNYTFQNQKPFKLMLFSELEHSEVKKIDLRANIGFGVGHKLYNKNGVDISISEVILPNYYQNMVFTTPTSKIGIKNRNNTSIYASTRLKCVYKTGIFTFTSINMIQPSLYTKDYDGTLIKTNDNINFRSNNTLDFLIKHGFSFGVAYNYDYQSYLNYINRINNLSLSNSDAQFIFYLKKGFIKKKN